ncbi:hypothetical protein PJL18_03879 [Paenarthrobacter nicotinovorans]|nr:hypothetical protein [Paenarthrobacter nicotinovorans]
MVKGPATASNLAAPFVVASLFPGTAEVSSAAALLLAAVAVPAVVSGPVGCESCGPGLSWFMYFSFVRRRLGQSGPVIHAGFRGNTGHA